MSAYNQYLQEFNKLDDEIAQQHSARQLALENFAKFKQLILTHQELLANFNGVINELKLVTQYDDLTDLEKSFSALGTLNKNLLAAKEKIKIIEIKEQFNALVNYCRNEMTLAEIDNSLGQLKTIQAEDEQVELNRLAELKRQEELKFQADELKRQQEEAERKYQEELERQAEKNRKREEFKTIGVKHEGLIVEPGIALDPNTDLMWTTAPLVVQRLQQDGKTPYTEILFDFSETLKTIQEYNQNGGFAGYTDWQLPIAEEFETLQGAIDLHNYYKKSTEYNAKLAINKKKTLKFSFFGAIVTYICTLLYCYHDDVINQHARIFHSSDRIPSHDEFVQYFYNHLPVYLIGGLFWALCGFAVVFGIFKIVFYLQKDFIDIVPIMTGNEYWTNSPSADEQHGQICCRSWDKIIKRNKLKFEKHHVTLVRKF